MAYITIDDVQDKLLKVTDTDVAEANLFIDDLAARLGIDAQDIQIPVSFMVRRLAISFACYNRCLQCVGTDATTTFDGGSRQDIYAQKLDFYNKELENLQKKITAADFTGQKVGGASIGLWRS